MIPSVHPWARFARGVALAWAFALMSPGSAWADCDFPGAIAEFNRLRKNAVPHRQREAPLERAAGCASDDAQRAVLALSRGIFHGDKGQDGESREFFKEALTLDSTLRLPEDVDARAPTARNFQLALQQVLEERGAREPPSEAPSAEGTLPREPRAQDTPRHEEGRPDALAPPTPLSQDEARPLLDVASAPGLRREVPVGKVAVGLGVSAAVLGTYFERKQNYKTSMYLFGTAGYALTGALFLWLIDGDDAEAPRAARDPAPQTLAW